MQSSDPITTTRLRVALGTLVAIEVRSGNPTLGEAAVEAAMGCMRRVERCMHPTRAGSDLAALAGAAPQQELQMDPWTVEVLSLSQRLQAASDGVFDPCLPHQPGRLQDLRVLAADRVRAARAVHLDLGGIAKGYAVDRAVEALLHLGCDAGLVNAGGDARAFGPDAQRMQCRVGTGFRWIELRNGSVAVSAREAAGPGEPDAPSRPPEHRGYYRGAGATQDPVGLVWHRNHAVVLAASAAVADALTKCVMLAPPVLAARVLRQFGAEALEL